MTYQVASVTKALNSLLCLEICDQGNTVVISKDGWAIASTLPGTMTLVSPENGVYVLRTWVPAAVFELGQWDVGRQDMEATTRTGCIAVRLRQGGDKHTQHGAGVQVTVCGQRGSGRRKQTRRTTSSPSSLDIADLLPARMWKSIDERTYFITVHACIAWDAAGLGKAS